MASRNSSGSKNHPERRLSRPHHFPIVSFYSFRNLFVCVHIDFFLHCAPIFNDSVTSSRSDFSRVLSRQTQLQLYQTLLLGITTQAIPEPDSFARHLPTLPFIPFNSSQRHKPFSQHLFWLYKNLAQHKFHCIIKTVWRFAQLRRH